MKKKHLREAISTSLQVAIFWIIENILEADRKAHLIVGGDFNHHIAKIHPKMTQFGLIGRVRISGRDLTKKNVRKKTFSALRAGSRYENPKKIVVSTHFFLDVFDEFEDYLNFRAHV